jgi:hypothetical protein
MEVDETTTTDVAATPLTVTVASVSKSVPVMVIAVPPAVDPVLGSMLVIVGVNVGSALALDNPETPIARARTPVIRSLERLFNLEGFDREISKLVI